MTMRPWPLTCRTIGLTGLSLALLGCGDKTENTLVAANGAPVADAGSDITQSADDPISLDGGGSYDPDGDAITYAWAFDRIPDGSALAEDGTSFTTNNSASATSSFRADVAGTYVVQLVVSDSEANVTSPDYAIVVIEEGNLPVANAGPDMEGEEGDSFTLNGASSYDSMGRELTYEWDFASVPSTSSLSGPDNAEASEASFTADAGGVYIASLVVNNGLSNSAPDTAIITVSTNDPQAPVAIAGNDQEDAEDCTDIALDGSGSYDANGDDLTYQWDLQLKPDESVASNDNIDDRSAAVTTFWPDEEGEYLLSLAVHDGIQWSTPDLISITVWDRVSNTEPSVDAGNPTSHDGGEAECTEDGYSYACESCEAITTDLGSDASAYDADGDPMVYSWEVISGTAEIDDASALSTTVTLSEATPTEPDPDDCEDTEYEFLLTVTDCVGSETTDTVVYTVTCCGVEATDSGRSKAKPAPAGAPAADAVDRKARPGFQKLEKAKAKALGARAFWQKDAE